jgi:hypothetical protein
MNRKLIIAVALLGMLALAAAQDAVETVRCKQ